LPWKRLKPGSRSNKKQATGEDYPDAVIKHCDDARQHLSGNRPDGAAYLAGYAVECAIRTLILDRVRNRVAWFGELGDPPWEVRVEAKHKGPPIIVFYSFKGGVGRTTALASFAVQRARAGDRVVVMDADLDAPGIGLLFAAGQEDVAAQPGHTRP
jgi:Mrp family chromosome partitioning ATPase